MIYFGILAAFILGMYVGTLVVKNDDEDWGQWEVIDENVEAVEKFYPKHEFDDPNPIQLNKRVDVLRRVHTITGDVQYKNVERL